MDTPELCEGVTGIADFNACFETAILALHVRICRRTLPLDRTPETFGYLGHFQCASPDSLPSRERTAFAAATIAVRE
jgi:hypothetical protein